MGYRGQDIDLRTPQTWAATPTDLAGAEPTYAGPRGRGYEAVRSGPIWVDETLLASCNHAFDVALAHRSGEVRLEHLLHALTRIDSAVERLEARGVRVAGLRRESATIIASEIPVGLSNGKSSPRRSAELEEALRAAAQLAYRRNAPASVDDLLDALLDHRPDLPGLGLLERHAGLALREPPAPRPRAAYVPDTEYAEPPRERPRRATGQYYVGEAEALPRVRDLGPSTTDHIQNSRIEALEQMVRALGGQIAGHRDDASRASIGLDDRLQSIERLVSAGSGSVGASQQLVERLTLIERAIEGRIAEMSIATASLVERLTGVERAIEGRLSDLSLASTGLVERLDKLELTLTERPAGPVDLAPIEERFGLLEVKLDPEKLSGRFDLLEEALLAREPAVDAGLAERIGDLDRSMDEIASSVRAVEEAERAHRTEIYETHAALTSEIKAVTAAVAAEAQRSVARHGEAGNAMQALGARMVALEKQLADGAKAWADARTAYADDLKELHEALMKLNTNQHTLAASLDQWRLDASGDASVISNRLASLESEAARPMRLLEQLSSGMDSLSGNMETMHKLTVQRYYRRNRFWYWLFGTDDWVAASWPSQAARIEAEQHALRGARR